MYSLWPLTCRALSPFISTSRGNNYCLNNCLQLKAMHFLNCSTVEASGGSLAFLFQLFLPFCALTEGREYSFHVKWLTRHLIGLKRIGN